MIHIVSDCYISYTMNTQSKLNKQQKQETKKNIVHNLRIKLILYCFPFFLALQVLLFKTTNLSESRIKAGYWDSICSLFQSLSTPLSILLQLLYINNYNSTTEVNGYISLEMGHENFLKNTTPPCYQNKSKL